VLVAGLYGGSAFGFSFGDLVQIIHLINNVCKALGESGGAGDGFSLVLIELQSLELLIQRLADGSWDYGLDAIHLGAIKGLALTYKVHIAGYLTNIGSCKSFGSGEAPSIKAETGGVGAAKLRWVVQIKDWVKSFRNMIVANGAPIKLLLQLNLILFLLYIRILEAHTQNLPNVSVICDGCACHGDKLRIRFSATSCSNILRQKISWWASFLESRHNLDIDL